MSHDYWMVFAVLFMSVSHLTQAVDQNEEDSVNEYEDSMDNQISTDVASASDDGLKYYFRRPHYDLVDPKSIEYEPEIQLRDVFSKRSRLYRKYPGKRQNGGYVNDIYDCNPSSKETIRLLYAIHQARLGDIQHIVFCNRLRNPKGIIPNPRYIGKRSNSSPSDYQDEN
ncbi:hypothetical protein V9T40_001982 [Parthenolecanium corni]|uniref:Uncharacterized protein n=1 Tax=Parthenolecanium corni TaxID=536013 RepID=A0AAN9TJL9_9HEMI